jgi:hypothetical protein
MSKIHLSKDVTFDLDAMMQTWALLGNKGGGKTMTMQMLFELVHNAGAQAVAFTPVSNWWSLLYDADGKGPGLSKVYIFGGKRAHYPLRPQDGKLLAKLLVQKKISAVIDVSMLRKGERRRLLTDLLDELWYLKKLEDAPDPLVMFMEEAHAFCPQKPQPDEAQMLGAVEDICREGRNYGIGFVIGDQRPATVNKNVLALVEVLDRAPHHVPPRPEGLQRVDRGEGHRVEDRHRSDPADVPGRRGDRLRPDVRRFPAHPALQEEDLRRLGDPEDRDSKR